VGSHSDKGVPEGFIGLGDAYDKAFRRLEDVANLEGGLANQVPADGFDHARAVEALDRARARALRAAMVVLLATEARPWFERAKARSARAEETVAALADWAGNMKGGVFSATDPAAQAAYDDARDRVEALMRSALASGDLRPWIVDHKKGIMMPVVADRDEWKRSGIAPGYGLQSTIDDDLCPGPKALAGLPLSLIEADFEAWLARQTPAAPAESEEPLPDANGPKEPRRKGRPVSDPDRIKQAIQIVLKVAVREYPPTTSAKVGYNRMAKHLANHDEVEKTSFGASAIEKILRNAYRSMPPDIRSPYPAARKKKARTAMRAHRI
jgi:hypothetical protein